MIFKGSTSVRQLGCGGTRTYMEEILGCRYFAEHAATRRSSAPFIISNGEDSRVVGATQEADGTARKVTLAAFHGSPTPTTPVFVASPPMR
jgi:hypothetical protein